MRVVVEACFDAQARAAARGGRTATRGGRAIGCCGRGEGHGPVVLDPPLLILVGLDHTPGVEPIELVDKQHHAQVQFDLAQALGFAACKPIPQKAIEAGILET